MTTESETPSHNQNSDRLTARFVLGELGDLVLLEKGSLFTTRELLLRPGKTIHAYLSGDRDRLTSPLKYLLMTVTMVVFGYHIVLPLIGHSFGLPNNDPSLETLQPYIDQLRSAAEAESNTPDVNARLTQAVESLKTRSEKRLMDMTLSWMNVALALAVPIYAGLTWFTMRRNLYFVEHFVAHAYIYGIQCVLAFILTPLMFSPRLSISMGIYMLASTVYQVFAWKQTFQLRSIKEWVIAIAVLCISLVIYLLGVTVMSVVILTLSNLLD